MTTPAALPPDCRVYLDGVRYADGGTPGEVDTDPVVLTDLRVEWGRDNTLDQPDPSTCSFTVLDVAGGRRALDDFRIGSRIDIVASATIYPDPTVPTIADPGFEAAPVGSTPASSTTNATVLVVAGGAYGAHAARIEPVRAESVAAVLFPPAPFSASPTAWDALPRSAGGQTWRYGATVSRPQLAGLPGVVIRVEPVGFTAPRADAVVRFAAGAGLTSPADAPNGWIVLVDDIVPPDDLWLGLRVEVGVGPAWDDVDPALSWDALVYAPPWTLVATNYALTPAGNNLAGFETNGLGTLALVAGWSTWPSCVRHTRASTGSARLGVKVATTLPTSATVTVRVQLRASAAATVSFYLRPDTASTTNQVVLATGVTVAAGVSSRTYTVTSPAAALSATGGVALVWASGAVNDTLDVTGIQVEVGATVGAFFDGDTADTVADRYSWAGTVKASASTYETAAGLPAWDDLGAALVDDLVMLAPAAGAARQGNVFSGRVTDLEAAYDEGVGGTLLDVICQSHLAELGNRYVGDTPWSKETLSARFSRIVAASGQDIAYTVDPGVAGYQVSWRDVDNQPAARLLYELAQSVAGALWLASSMTTGPYVWLEDIDARPALSILVRQADLVIRIIPNPALVDGALSISACDVLLDPVRWVQTTEDDSTRIAVTWRDQTLDTEGNQDPTDRTLTIVDDAAEVVGGQRRIALSTQLTTEADADRVGDALLGRVRAPGWRLAGLTIRLALETDRLDARLLGLVMSILDATSRIGLALSLTDLPAWSPPSLGSPLPLYLEGGRFTNTDGAWELELLTSDARAQGASEIEWDEIPDTTFATRTNRTHNPRAVAGGAGTWTMTRAFGTGGAGTYSDLTGVTPEPVPGVTTARRKTWTTAATGNGGSGFTVRQTATLWFPVTPGETLTFSCYVRFAGAGTRTIQPIMQFFTGTTVGGEGSVVSQPTGASFSINPNTWTRVTWTGVVPATAQSAGFFPDCVAGGTLWAVGNTMDATACLVEAAGSAGAYFDGATADTATVDNAWSGTAHASTSTSAPVGAALAWTWDQVDPAITWNDLRGVGI